VVTLHGKLYGGIAIMPINKGMMSSSSNEWETPQDFFDKLNDEFGFTLDAAASFENHKCDRFYGKGNCALVRPWPGIVWCNPPYGRIIGKFIQKGYEESQKDSVVVMLIPSRTDTKYWHEYVMKAKEIRFVRGRLRFVGAPSNAPFPSAVVVFTAGKHQPSISTIEAK